MKTAIIVRRLKNTPTGQPYAIDIAECGSVEAGNEIAARWWGSGGTLSVVVTQPNGATDARYTKPYCDELRIPDEWPMPEAWERPTKPPEEDGPAKPPPDLFGKQQQKRELGPNACRCCYGDRGPHEGDNDRTPSGRLNDLRCPQCGRSIGGNRTKIYAMYMAYQQRLTQDQQSRVKPWR